MFPATIEMRLQTLFVFIVLLLCTSAQERKITPILNPDCSTCDPNTNTLLYIKADGSHDTIHQIWDFTRGVPTIIFAIGSVNSTLTITWDGSQPSKFTWSEWPVYSFSVVIDKLIEYDDVLDAGAYDGRCPHRAYPLRGLQWTRTDNVTTGQEAMLRMEAAGFWDGAVWRRGNIAVKLDLLPYKDYAVDLPHLIHTANSTLVDLSLVNVSTSDRYNASRLAWHVTLVSTDAAMDTMHYAMRKSLDDEHTPGVFEVIEIKTPESYSHDDGGFVVFRPVGYTQRERGVTTATVAHVYAFNRTSLARGSTAEVFYRKVDRERLLVQDMVVSFGDSGDGFYRRHNYTAWSFAVGYGVPPTEGFSLFVIVVISVGLGVPVLLALSGILYVVGRRCRQRNQPRRFTDDD